MKKRNILVGAIAIISMGGLLGLFCSHNKTTSNSLTPARLVANFSGEEDMPPTFDKKQVNNEEVKKYVFEEVKGGCIYSINGTTFLLTENTEAEEVICYADGASKIKSKPIAITTTGNYLILQNEQEEKLAIRMQKSVKDKAVIPQKAITLKDLSNQEKESLFYLIEE